MEDRSMKSGHGASHQTEQNFGITTSNVQDKFYPTEVDEENKRGNRSDSEETEREVGEK